MGDIPGAAPTEKVDLLTTLTVAEGSVCPDRHGSTCKHIDSRVGERAQKKTIEEGKMALNAQNWSSSYPIVLDKTNGQGM